MLALGSDVRSVQEVLGHSEPSTTLNIYGHTVPELQVRAVATIDATLKFGLYAAKRSLMCSQRLPNGYHLLFLSGGLPSQVMRKALIYKHFFNHGSVRIWWFARSSKSLRSS